MWKWRVVGGLEVEGEGGGWSEMIETADVLRRLLDR